MSRGRIGETIVRRDSVSSTMDEARLLAAAGAADGTVVVADHQTAGRGRAGRGWVEQPGDGLLMSVILRPAMNPECLAVLPLLVGVAVAEGVEAVVPVTCQLKWPNDIWVNGRKVGGILLTTHHDESVPTVIAGIGININTPEARLPGGATSLAVAARFPVEGDMVLTAVCQNLNAAYCHFVESGGTVDLAAWRSRAAMIGEWVSIVRGGAELTGYYHGIDDDGALLLETAVGRFSRVISGDLVRGPVVAR